MCWCMVCGALGLLSLVGLTSLIWQNLPFPQQRLTSWPASTRVTDRSGRVLLQTVGADEQWRFPVPLEEISPWLVMATVAAEDERFYRHQGVDWLAAARATGQNISAAQVVSGASTLSMQLCRMLDPRPRSFANKVVESVRAIQCERQLSKHEILEHYLNIAPYGGNLRGVEAAAQRYFGKRASELSLNEATLLAGIPQSPERCRPDRYPRRARDRQVYVLNRMQRAGMITDEQRSEALEEPIQLASSSRHTAGTHVAWMAVSRRARGGRTTIDIILQRDIERCVREHARDLPVQADIAVVVLNIETSQIVALVGSADQTDPVDGQVNGAVARRSPGSVLKPFIYGTAFDAGRLNADSMIPDEPIERAGWRPDNFDRKFDGMTTVAEALRRSRNVPAILVLEAIGVPRCVGVLESVGVRLSPTSVSAGGLSIAVGTAETTLLELTNAYATLGRHGIRANPRLFLDDPLVSVPSLKRSTCRVLTEILSTRHRTPRGLGHVTVADLPWFMWKTGTSSGRRDAWAIGHNGRFAVGVWTGRFSGSGHTRFVGSQAAEPLLARIFGLPQIVTQRRPLPPDPLPVNRPLVWKPDRNDRPRITSPVANAVYAGTTDIAVVPVRAQDSRNANWFLNGRLLSRKQPDRLELKPGHYELRCVTAAGAYSTVDFDVETCTKPVGAVLVP